jgi:peroxiredoxin
MIDRIGHLPDLPPSYTAAPLKHLTKQELSHLAVCARCRESLSFSRDLSVQLAALQSAPVPDWLLPAIQNRVQSGEQLLLPLSENQQPARKTRWLAVAAGLVAVVSLWTLWPRQSIVAGPNGGDLHFIGAFSPGSTIGVKYRDHGYFHDKNALRLRARFRTANDEEYNYIIGQTVAATIRREGDSFTGIFKVPSDAVFGAFAVEAENGERVDANGGRLWTQLIGTRSGKPTFDALTQAFYDVMGVSMEAALGILQQRARMYPERVDGWGELVAYERFMLGKAHFDSTYSSHMKRLLAFHEEYKNANDVPLDVADGIMGYAQQLHTVTHAEARPIALYWAERLRKYTTKNRWSRGRRLSTFVSISKTNPKAALDSMQLAWSDGDSLQTFAGNGLNFALEAKDSAGVALWSKRTAAANPQFAEFTYARLLATPAYRGLGLEGLRQTLHQLYRHDERWRPLDQGVSEYSRTDSARAGEVLARIAEGLTLSGNAAAALDTLAIATRMGWNPQVFRSAALAYLAAGDTARALGQLALVAVDPAASDSVRSVVSLLLAGHWASEWNHEIAAARLEMERRVMADAVSRPIAVSPRISDQQGKVQQLDAMAHGSVHVVTFWSRYCAPSRRDLSRLDGLAQNLSKHDIPLFAISQESPSEDLRRYIENAKLATPVFFDTRREAARAFNQWATPVYFVVDQSGIVRFSGSEMDKVLTRAVAVQLASRGQ